MSQFLDFLFNNNSMIIQVLIPAVLVLVLFLAYRSFSMEDDEASTSSGSGISAKELEATLAKVLEKAHAVPSAASAMLMDGVKNDESAQKLLKEIDRLKAELDAVKVNLDQAKAQGAPAPTANAAESEKLKAQLEEMKGKLGEYEIIAEDIADLSFYKEQTAKLQKELEALKSGKVAATVVTAAAVAEEEISIAGSAKATAGAGGEPKPPSSEPEPLPEPTVPPSIPNAPEPPGPVTEPEPQGPPTTEPEPTQPPVQGAAAPAKDESYDEILAEFNAVVEEKTGKKIDDLGDLDMDKMLNEAANIKMDGPEVSVEQALGSGLDENKLIAEAADLDKAVSSEDQKLMGQFEKFVKNE